MESCGAKCDRRGADVAHVLDLVGRNADRRRRRQRVDGHAGPDDVTPEADDAVDGRGSHAAAVELIVDGDPQWRAVRREHSFPDGERAGGRRTAAAAVTGDVQPTVRRVAELLRAVGSAGNEALASGGAEGDGGEVRETRILAIDRQPRRVYGDRHPVT